ncbi:hypothetical protein MRX96_044883 [Rhipicephalus microplus]
MAAPVPDHVIRQGLRTASLQGQIDRRGAPLPDSSPLNGLSLESLSPSPPPVRAHEHVALTPPSNRVTRGEPPGQRHREGAPAGTQPQQQDERLCIILWVVGASIAFPLVFSSWLVIVPFVIRATRTTAPPVIVPSQSEMTSESEMTSALSMTTTIPSTSTNPWQNISSTCIVPVTLSTLPPNLNVSAPYSFGPSNESSRPVFCLFNNTRVSAWRSITNVRWNYVFATLPFALCPYVVYWSVSIEDGNLTSRLPSFDVQYGLYRLRAIADSLNFRSVKILLALGGYPEDSPHFSRLGWDKVTLNHLLDNVVHSLSRFVLNGVTVHWIEARTGCQGPNDPTVLKTLLRDLRTHFNRMLPDAMVTVMLQVNAASQLVAQEAADVVDYIFLATQNEHGSQWTRLVQFCRTRTESMHNSYRWFASGIAALKLRKSQLCLTDSLMPFALKGSFTGKFNFAYVGDPEHAPIHLECSWPSICSLPTAGSCTMHIGRRVSTSRETPDRMFLIDGAGALRNRLDINDVNVTQWLPERGNFTESCVLLLDLDADNYVDQCGATYARYVLMRSFYYSTLGRPLTGDGETNGTFPVCR